MEVHHHPDLHHKRKHFSEYVLEFFMIFLAVTMGFLLRAFASIMWKPEIPGNTWRPLNRS